MHKFKLLFEVILRLYQKDYHKIQNPILNKLFLTSILKS